MKLWIVVCQFKIHAESDPWQYGLAIGDEPGTHDFKTIIAMSGEQLNDDPYDYILFPHLGSMVIDAEQDRPPKKRYHEVPSKLSGTQKGRIVHKSRIGPKTKKWMQENAKKHEEQDRVKKIDKAYRRKHKILADKSKRERLAKMREDMRKLKERLVAATDREARNEIHT